MANRPSDGRGDMTTSALEETRSDGEQDEAATAAVTAGRAFSVLLVVCGGLGILASWVITLDKFKLLEGLGFYGWAGIDAWAGPSG